MAGGHTMPTPTRPPLSTFRKRRRAERRKGEIMEEDDMFSDERDFRVSHRVLARRVGVKPDELLDMLETLDICSLGLIKMRGGLCFTETQAGVIINNFDFIRRMHEVIVHNIAFAPGEHVDWLVEMAQKRLINRGLAGFPKLIRKASVIHDGI